ncbi:8-oxoguanine deaminase [Nitriliruptoraceae bacterium ZYF776]|nr:8-oxoguanine deaminase [Profundirhabdus halotolerans]
MARDTPGPRLDRGAAADRDGFRRTRRRRPHRGPPRRHPEGHRRLRVLLRPAPRPDAVGPDPAQPPPGGAHRPPRRRTGLRGAGRGRRRDRRGCAGRGDLRARAPRPARLRLRGGPLPGRADRRGRRRAPRAGGAGPPRDRRRLRGPRPADRPGGRAGRPADPPGRQRLPPPAAAARRPRRGHRRRRRRGDLRGRHAGPGVPRSGVRPGRPHRGRRGGAVHLDPVAARRPRAGRRLPGAARGQGPPDPRRRRRGVRGARGRQPPGARLPAGAAHRAAGQDAVLARGELPRPRPPPPGAHVVPPPRHGRRRPRQGRGPGAARRRRVRLDLAGGPGQRRLLRRRALPDPARDHRRVGGTDQQPALRRHARVRGRAGLLRPRGADGPPRRRARDGPGRAAAAQRPRPRRPAADGPGHHRHRPGARGHRGVRRPRPAARPGRRRRSAAAARWRRPDRHPRRGATRHRRRGQHQEPHVLGGLRRLLHRRRAARPRRRWAADRDRPLRRGRGRPGLRHLGPADRPHRAARRPGAAAPGRHHHRVGRVDQRVPADLDERRGGPARRPRRARRAARTGSRPRRRGRDRFAPGALRPARRRGGRARRRAPLPAGGAARRGGDRTGARAPPPADRPAGRARPGRRPRVVRVRRAPRHRRRGPGARAGAGVADRHRAGRRAGAQPPRRRRPARGRHRAGRRPGGDGGDPRRGRSHPEPVVHRLPHPDRAGHARGRRHADRAARAGRAVRRQGRRRAPHHLLHPGGRRRDPRGDRPAPLARAGPARRHRPRTGPRVRRVLRGARWPGDVAIEDGWIVAVGDVPAQDGDEVVRVDGGIVTAGLINTHHHLYQWMTRGRAVGCDLFGWLTTLYPVWARLDVEDVAAAARVGLAELALSGCTTAADHHYLVPRGDDTVFDATAEAAHAVGIRLHLARGSMDLGQSDGGLPPDRVVEDIDAIVASTVRVADRWHDGVRTVVTVAPCSPFSVSADLLRVSAELARDRGLRLHTHLAETREEEADCLARFGKRPLAVLDELGWVADDVWFAHGIHFDDAEVARLADAGAGVAHCPSSNARLAAGFCRTPELLAAGVPVGLGVDGVASNEQGTLVTELRQAVFSARQGAQRPDALSPAQALHLATAGGAACLGRDDVGRLEVGARGDVVVWPADDLVDVPDPVDGLVLGPERRAQHVLVDGEFVVRDGGLLGFDVDAARAELGRRARRLWS